MSSTPDTIVVVGFGSLSEEQLRSDWADPVCKAWPTGQVDASICTPQLLAMKLELTARGVESEWTSPLLLVVEDGASEGLSLVIDSLQRQLAPAVILTKQPSRVTDQLETEGVVVMPWQTEPSILAAMLMALSRRQKTVQQIAVELRISQRAQGGVSGEMQRLQEELASAADVQREFLPRELPEIPELEFGVVFRPVGYVSGDMYDIFRLDERTMGFFLADVVGHGVPAALLTVALCRGLKTLDRTVDGWKPRRPCEVLARLNDDLVARQLSGQRFATGIYGIVDLVTGKVTISCGGHPPPLIVAGENTAEIEASGPLLGVFADAEFDEFSWILEPGQSLVLYTDGVETAFPVRAGSCKPTKIYRQIIAKIGAESAERGQTVASLLQEFDHELDLQTGSLHGIDDITVVAISRPLPTVARKAA